MSRWPGSIPLAREEFLDGVLRTICERGQTVVFSTHSLDDVQRLADTVGILYGGRLLIHRNIDDLLATTKRIRITLTEGKPPDKKPETIIWQTTARPGMADHGDGFPTGDAGKASSATRRGTSRGHRHRPRGSLQGFRQRPKGHPMKSLLWREYRRNRLLLGIGFALSVLPYLYDLYVLLDIWADRGLSPIMSGLLIGGGIQPASFSCHVCSYWPAIRWLGSGRIGRPSFWSICRWADLGGSSVS